MLDIANHRVLKSPGVRLKSIPNIKRHCVRVFFQESFPLRWTQLIVLIRRDRASIQSDDLRPDLDDQLRKSPGVPGADLDLDVAEACVCLEQCDISVHTFVPDRRAFR